MWKEFTAEGFLAYPNFLETVTQILPMYYLRAFGGSLYFIGALLFLYNVWKTAAQGSFLRYENDEAAPKPVPTHKESIHRRLEGRPLQFTILALIVILIGGLVEIVPMYLVKSNVLQFQLLNLIHRLNWKAAIYMLLKVVIYVTPR